MPSTIVTGEVRFSYVNIFEPVASKFNPDKKEYSIVLLIPKQDAVTKAAIDRAIQETIAESADKTFSGYTSNLTMPIHDGDGLMPQKGVPYPAECRGHWVMTAKSSAKSKPEVVDENRQPILSATQVYSGCYGRVSLRFYAYNNGSRGIGCGLGNVQKLRDGEPLGGGTSAAEDFGAPIPSAAPAPYPAAPNLQPGVLAPPAPYPAAPAPYPTAPPAGGYGILGL